MPQDFVADIGMIAEMTQKLGEAAASTLTGASRYNEQLGATWANLIQPLEAYLDWSL
jgi:hypothetical protein